MKHVLTFTFTLLLSCAAYQVCAVDLAQNSPDITVLQEKLGKIPFDAEAFVKMTPKEFAAKTGKKLSFVEKIAFKITQKRIKKQLAKAKDGKGKGRVAGASKMGTLAAILAGLGLIFTFSQVSILVVLGLVLGIMGFIFGLIGIKRDENKILAIVGTALGAVVIFIWILAVIIVASWL